MGGEADIDCLQGSLKGQPKADQKRMDDRPIEGGTLNLGDPERVPLETKMFSEADCDQHKEEADGTHRESDSPIVVGDGRTGHTPTHSFGGAGMAKGWTEKQDKQSTHVGKGILPISVSSSLLAQGSGLDTLYQTSNPNARFSEEPGAVVPHAGICEGGAEQSAFLPQSVIK